MARATIKPDIAGYQIMEYLGSGARSTIWRVRQRRTGKFHALKQIIKRPGDDGRFLAQAMSEFAVAQHFNHPAIRRCERIHKIRRLFSVRELHLFMELCEGDNCQSSRPTDLSQAVKTFLEVARALGKSDTELRQRHANLE